VVQGLDSLFATSHTLKLGDGTTIDSANYTSPLAHVYPTHGSYQVTLVVSNSCGGTDSIVQIITVEEQDSIPESVGEEPLAGAVRLFPNPSDGAFTLLINNQAGATLNYYVTDLQGRIVQPMTRNAIGGDEARFELDLTRVSAGLYLLHLDVDGERTELRLEVF
ncbi:MAG: PKD domain-containing protein, partial [Bacteroidota bacterium]